MQAYAINFAKKHFIFPFCRMFAASPASRKGLRPRQAASAALSLPSAFLRPLRGVKTPRCWRPIALINPLEVKWALPYANRQY